MDRMMEIKVLHRLAGLNSAELRVVAEIATQAADYIDAQATKAIAETIKRYGKP